MKSHILSLATLILLSGVSFGQVIFTHSETVKNQQFYSYTYDQPAVELGKYAGTVVFKNCTFVTSGAACVVSAAPHPHVVFLDCTFTSPFGSSLPALFFDHRASLVAHNCQFEGWVAVYEIKDMKGSDPVLINCTLNGTPVTN
jgi:hypothetical protein